MERIIQNMINVSKTGVNNRHKHSAVLLLNKKKLVSPILINSTQHAEMAVVDYFLRTFGGGSSLSYVLCGKGSEKCER